MKKWLLFLIAFLAIGIGCLYFVIPSRIRIQQRQAIAVNANGFVRHIADENKWSAWWPQDNGMISPGTFRFKNYTYTIREKKFSSVVMLIKSEDDSLLSELFFFPMDNDSVAISWQAQTVSSYNPVNRLQRFFRTKSISRDMETILQNMRNFYLKEENLYGMAIKKDLVSDSTLITTSITTDGYPTVDTIYDLINKLQAFAKKNAAKQTGLPMLNVNTSDSLSYRTQVALPVDKKLKDEGAIVYRWMLGGGKILVTEVKGGPSTINTAFNEMSNYVKDFRRIAPAIPFQSLVTDRQKERDTSKWVTKIYWPVM